MKTTDVSTETYRAYMDGGIYERYGDIPLEYRPALEVSRLGVSEYDYVGMLGRGRAWVIEPLRELQPQSFQAFQEMAGPLLLAMRLVPDPHRPGGEPDVRAYLLFDVSGRMVEVQPTFAGDTYEEGNDCFGSLLSLPDGLARSWLWRTKGWRIPGGLPEHIRSNRQLIGHPGGGNWQDTDNYLDSLGRGWKKKYLPKIVEMFPDTETNKNGIKRFRFACFLDTRPSGVGGPVGDQFFVCSTRRDQVVYHIHQGDIDNIRILRDPADAIDRYCAHVLLRQPGEFDFSPWSEPLQ